MTSSNPELAAIVGQFLNAAVHDQQIGALMLAKMPWLRDETWLHGESLVHFLAIENHSAGVTWLLDNGFDVDATNDFGNTAFFDVVTIHNFEMARLLLRYGANPAVSSPTRGYLRELAELMDDIEIFEFVETICPSEN